MPQAIESARASNTEIVIWRDGKMADLTPDEATQVLATNLGRGDPNLIPSLLGAAFDYRLPSIPAIYGMR